MTETVSPALLVALQAAVPLEIMRMEQNGGPLPHEIAAARMAADTIASRADVMMFGSGKRGEAGRIFAETARALAVLAFQPGGVKFFGMEWKAKQ